MEYQWNKTTTKTETLQAFLKAEGISSRTLKKIRQGQGKIFWNNQLVKGNLKVNKLGTVRLQMIPEHVDPSVFQSKLPINIIMEDDYFVAINKSPNLSSVPGPNDQQNTLANRVLGYAQRQQHPYVPHILTRLDFDTSGLVLFAKSNFIQSMLQEQISNHTLKKIYYALVSGHLTQQHAMIDLPLEKESFESARRVVRESGKFAQTEYWVEQEFADATLVKVQLHTGRTHQIRAHFAALNHPLVGDQLYGGPTKLIQRQMLHAYQLELINPFTKQKQKFVAPLANDFQKVIEMLKQN